MTPDDRPIVAPPDCTPPALTPPDAQGHASPAREQGRGASSREGDPMLSRVFVLEDEDYRLDFFAERFGIPRTQMFRHPDDLVRAVQAVEGAVLVFLDHDLGLRIWEPYPREITGADAAKALAEIGRPGAYLVHSLNLAGAQRMVGHLVQIPNAAVRRVPVTDLMGRDREWFDRLLVQVGEL